MNKMVQRLIAVSAWAGLVTAAIGCTQSHDTDTGNAKRGAKSSGSHHTTPTDDDDGDEVDSEDGEIAIGKPAKVDDDGNVEFAFDATIPAGQEMFKCIYGQFPTDSVTAVSGAESHYTPGSHHVLAYRSDLTAVPADQKGVWDCADGSWFTHQRGSYYEAQQPEEERHLPDGIAHKFMPGEVIILQAHYINVTDADIDAHVQLKLHTIDVDDVKEEAGTIYFNDTSISIPPHARAGVTMTCPIPQDINLAFLWSHMHKRGTHFVVTTDDPIAAEKLGGAMLYEEHDWSEPKPREYPEGEEYELHAGSHITFSCEFQNDSDDTFKFGNSAETNEMCILHGMYWPRMSTLSEQCYIGRIATRQMF
jgi:hypothetical protein